MVTVRRFLWSAWLGAAVLGACSADPKCEPGRSSCAEDPAAGAGGAAGAAGAMGGAGASGASGAGGEGGAGGVVMMEPPIVGPAPTACVPVAASAASKVVRYSGGEALEGLALRRLDLFAWDASGIVRLSEGATALERVTAAAVSEVLPAGLRLYWTDGASLYRVDYDADGAAPERVVEGLRAPATLLRNDETSVFYAHASSSSVWRQPLDGSAGAQLVSGVSAQDLHVHGGGVLYASGSKIERVMVESGAVTTLVAAAPRPVLEIETNGVELVWSDGVEVFAMGLGGAGEAAPLTQAGPSASGVGQSRIKRIVLHGSAVYFADNAGNIGTAALSGSSCALLYAAAGDVRGMVVDDESVYVNVRVGESSELWALAH